MKKNLKVIIIAAMAVVLFAGILIMYTNNKSSDATSSINNGHDESNSDKHHTADNQADSSHLEDLTNQSKVAIDIIDFNYNLRNIKIKKGTTVTWANQDIQEHNVMKQHENDNDAHNAPTKNEVMTNVLASQMLSIGESYSHTFNEVGSNPYHCSPHPYMKGSVTVVE